MKLICRQCDSTRHDTDDKEYDGWWMVYDPGMWYGGFTVEDEIGLGHDKHEAMDDFVDGLDPSSIRELLWTMVEFE